MKYLPKLLAVIFLLGLGWFAGRESVRPVEPEAMRPTAEGPASVRADPSAKLVGDATPRVLSPARNRDVTETDDAIEPSGHDDLESRTESPTLDEFELKYAGTTAAERKLARATIREALERYTDPIVERRIAEGDYIDVTDMNGKYNFEELGLGKSGYCSMRHAEHGQGNWSYLFTYPAEDYPLVDAYRREIEWLGRH